MSAREVAIDGTRTMVGESATPVEQDRKDGGMAGTAMAPVTAGGLAVARVTIAVMDAATVKPVLKASSPQVPDLPRALLVPWEHSRITMELQLAEAAKLARLLAALGLLTVTNVQAAGTPAGIM